MTAGSTKPVGSLSQSELTTPLQKVFNRNEIEIIAWDQQVLTVGGTSGAAVTKLTGTVRVDGYDSPWSLIRKKVFAPPFGSSDSSTTNVLDSVDYWKREWLLYESGLLDQLPKGLAAPCAFHIATEPDGYSLWQEVVQDEIGAVWSLAHYGTVAYHMGVFHGAYLTEQPLPSYPWLTRHICRQRERWAVSRDQLTTLRQQAQVARGWPDDVAAGILAIWQERERFFGALQQLPLVFQHGDYSRKNLFARQVKNGGLETVAIDWGYAGIGAIGEDLACLVGGSVLMIHVAAAQLAELEGGAWDGYVQGLRDSGWHGDVRWVRLGYTVAAALRYAFMPIIEAMALTPALLEQLEAVVGRPLEEITDNCILLRRFILQRAHEARQLMALLPQSALAAFARDS